MRRSYPRLGVASIKALEPGATVAYGMIVDVAEGTVFPDRRALFEAGVHRDIQRGITGRKHELGAESIVLSDGYEDDVARLPTKV